MSNIILWTAGAYFAVGAVVLWRGRLVAFQHFAVARSVGEPWFRQAAILALTGGFLLMLWPFAVRWLFDPRERERAAFEREWARPLAITRHEWAEGPDQGEAPDQEEGPDRALREQQRREADAFKRRYRRHTLITPFGRGVEYVPIERSDRDGTGEG